MHEVRRSSVINSYATDYVILSIYFLKCAEQVGELRCNQAGDGHVLDSHLNASPVWVGTASNAESLRARGAAGIQVSTPDAKRGRDTPCAERGHAGRAAVH